MDIRAFGSSAKSSGSAPRDPLDLLLRRMGPVGSHSGSTGTFVALATLHAALTGKPTGNYCRLPTVVSP